MIFLAIFSIWSVQYQYLCVVNLSRRQTLIKIFTKYLPPANINISAIFIKQNQRVSSCTLCAILPQQQVNTELTVLDIFYLEATLSAGHLQYHTYSYSETEDTLLKCRRFLLPVSVLERAACPGNCLIHPPTTTTITFICCSDHMTSDQPIIALSWLHVVFASLWNLS